jgi:predicted regulator of Ras-like GTPase activity (Roadblock/LC7/MglB family)
VSTAEKKRSVYYAKDIHQMNLILGKFLQKSRALTVLLVDEAGHLVSRQGENSPTGEDTVAALVAGTYGASQAMAAMLGADEFSTLIPCGDGRNLMLLRAGDQALLAVTFGDDASGALIRTYALEAVRRVEAIFGGPHMAEGEPDERIHGQRFESEIDEALTDVFG